MNKYFKLIQNDIDVALLLAEIDSQTEMWLSNTSRQEKINVQKDTNTIFLRRAVRRADIHNYENQECETVSTAAHFPRAMHFLNQVATTMESSLSRAAIVRLKPRSERGRTR